MEFRVARRTLAGVFLVVASTVATLAARNLGDMPVLTKIESHTVGALSTVAIEATDPVPYVASQPDPTTFVVELRDVAAGGYANHVTPSSGGVVSAVAVDSGRAEDGATVTRVRMSLSRALRPRVRSARNVIFVEADGTAMSAAASSGDARAALHDVQVTQRGAATALTLTGTGRLTASSITETTEGPKRLVIDLPFVVSTVPTVKSFGQGPIARVRVTQKPRQPDVTQVAVELSRAATYRVETSPQTGALTLVFDEPVRDPIAAIGPDSKQVIPPQPPAAAPAATAASADAPATAAPRPSAPRAALANQGSQGTPQAAGARFTGHTVSLDFQGADLRAVLRTFAEISGLNVVIDPTIQGTVDVALRDVPWDQALDIILKANKLGYMADGTIVRVAPLTVLADEEAQKQKLAEAQALSGELRVLTRALSYARADDLKPLITATALSKRGTIQTDVRTNTLIINDLPERLQQVESLIASLDSPQPQVEIEARIVQTTRDFARTLGVQWGVNGAATVANGNAPNINFPANSAIRGATTAVQGDPTLGLTNTAVNLGVTGATSGLGVALGSVAGAFNLDVALSALEKQGQGRLLSTPRVSTQNNVEAEITQGVQIPIQTIANNTVTVTFKDAALTLKVTPQITAANTVIMRIALENAAPDFSRSVNNIPPIDTQRAVTQVLVNNGDTTVIGGIFVSREQSSQDRTPGLYRLPLLGWLFKRDATTDESRELLIFITPRITRL